MHVRTGAASLALCSLLSALLYGCSPAATAGSSQREAKPIPVKTVSVVEEEIRRSTQQPATVLAYFEAEIRARATGYVRELNVDIGDVVKAGDPLAILDVPELDKQSEILKARIARAQSREKQAAAGVTLAEAEVAASEAQLAQTKSELAQVAASLAAAEAEFRRTEDLVERQSLESRLLDEARKRRDSELASQQATESAIVSARASVEVAQARLSSAQADLATAEAETVIAQRELEELDVYRNYATLKAPFDGVVTMRAVDPGDLVRKGTDAASSPPLFVVSQVDKVRVHIPVPEADAVYARRGDRVTLRFPFHAAEEPVRGQVTRVAGSLDPSTRTMLVEAEVENADGKLIPGMFGHATIELSSTVTAQTLPARAVRFTEDGHAYVYVLDANDTVTVTDVVTGWDDGHTIQIVEGLEASQRVVDAHLNRFTSGQKVRVLTN